MRGQRSSDVEHHPTEKQLLRFLSGETTRTENRTIVTHLLKECPACQRVIQGAWQPEIPESAYDEALGSFETSRRRRFPTLLSAGT